MSVRFDGKVALVTGAGGGKHLEIFIILEYNEYDNNNKKILVSDGKSLVIKNRSSGTYYKYPLKKTPLNFLLDKDYLIKKIMNLEFRNMENTLSIQELVIIEDNNDVKIMSTMPVNNNKWPSHYFTIYKDQNFYYDRSNSGYVAPEAIKNKVLNNKKIEGIIVGKAIYDGDIKLEELAKEIDA